MIISSPTDYRLAAKRRLPRFLFDYLDGAAVTESTMHNNVQALQEVALKQRVLQGGGNPELGVNILGSDWKLPFALGPVGATGMYARRGEVQAAQAAEKAGIPYTLSTVSVCSIEEVAAHAKGEQWSQLYVLKDRGYMKNALERAWNAGMHTLVFTVDMPLPGSRYRDRHSGMSGPDATLRQYIQAILHPKWAIDVGLRGKPLSFGNIEKYTGHPMSMNDYMGFLSKNFDPSISWKDLTWLRESWKGKLIIKGILDKADAREAKSMGAYGIIVSNHGGRQLDGAIPTARALPYIAEEVGDDLTVLADSGIRSGLDVVRMMALGAKGVLLGRSYLYALATHGEKGVANLIDLITTDIKVTMTLIGASSPADITSDSLANLPLDK